jgi:hypothetical protein
MGKPEYQHISLVVNDKRWFFTLDYLKLTGKLCAFYRDLPARKNFKHNSVANCTHLQAAQSNPQPKLAKECNFFQLS